MKLLLKLFSFRAMLELVVRYKLGNQLWSIIKNAVETAERSNPAAPGPTKFITAVSQIRRATIMLGLVYSESLLRWGIESAVRLLKEKAKL